MKTVKLKAGNAITLAHSMADLGVTPSGAIVFEVTGIPDTTSLAEVVRRFSGCCAVWAGKRSFEWGGS